MTEQENLKPDNTEKPAFEKIKKKKKKKAKKAIDLNIDKERQKIKTFDIRGVQTLFRTLSRNHYNLLKMVDNKASIILTINSIIISLLMGALYIAPEPERLVIQVAARVLIIFCVFSMVFALFSMLPHKYMSFMLKDSKYKGSLYAANFAGKSLAEFKLEMDRIMSVGENVYDEMINDLYFLGKVILGKQKMVLFSVAIFLTGLIGTAVYVMIKSAEL